MGEISILLLSKISAREQTTLSQIPKSCSSGAEKKVKHGPEVHPAGLAFVWETGVTFIVDLLASGFVSPDGEREW